jgi:hypothetical protein
VTSFGTISDRSSEPSRRPARRADETRFIVSLRHLQVQAFGGVEDGGPERVGGHGDRDPLLVSMPASAAIISSRVRFVLRDIGGDDVVEPFVERTLHQVVHLEPQVGMLLRREGDHGLMSRPTPSRGSSSVMVRLRLPPIVVRRAVVEVGTDASEFIGTAASGRRPEPSERAAARDASGRCWSFHTSARGTAPGPP